MRSDIRIHQNGCGMYAGVGCTCGAWSAFKSTLDRVTCEERMLAERCRAEHDARECAPPDGPLTPTFIAGGRVITPCTMRTDSDGQFVVVLVDGRMCCLGVERGTDERTGRPVDREVLMLVDPSEDGKHEDAPDCWVARHWCEFEQAVRMKDPTALAVYGLVRFALVWRAGTDAERAKQAVSDADVVFGELGASEP